MFRVECFVDDKRLSQLLHAMTGVILGEPKIQPVANGKVKNGKATPANVGNAPEVFLDFVKKHKLKELGPDEFRKFTQSVGAAESSYSHYIGRLRKEGIIKKRAARKEDGNRSFYTVVSK